MGYLSEYQVHELKKKLVSDADELRREYKIKKSPYIHDKCNHSEVEHFLAKGWELDGNPLKSKTKIRKAKEHHHKFEDDIWCQLYELGYSTLNYDNDFHLPFSSNAEDKKQIDVIAVNDESILVVECKSSEKQDKRKASFKEPIESLRLRVGGHRKVLEQVFGTSRKIKFILATRNIRLSKDSIDSKRLKDAQAFLYNDQAFDYVNSLLKNYKDAATYQFLGLLFQGESINANRIEIPCVQGDMGKKKYYMFSIEPHLILKLGFVLHRTKANSDIEDPAYQRLLIPSRLKKITKFIDEGGYFPNSIIINFNTRKRRLEFQPSQKTGDSKSKTGILKIPNAYSIAYIIDGQHRVYGYANSNFLKSNTIPVVAFDGLDPSEQLEMFMDINQNQKAVSASLRLDLEEDLFWNSPNADERMKALRSSIVKGLNQSEGGPLFRKISVGEDKSELKLKSFIDGLRGSQLLPRATKSKFDPSSACLYDVANTDFQKEMTAAKSKIVGLINSCFEFVEDHFEELFDQPQNENLIVSNRGVIAFITLIGDLNRHLTAEGDVALSSNELSRFNAIRPYLEALLQGIEALEPKNKQLYLDLLGQGAPVKWLRMFQDLINQKHKVYEPHELIDWRERQNEDNQKRAIDFSHKIEKKIKSLMIEKMSALYGEKWPMEIINIKVKCQELADRENAKNYKEGRASETVEWTEMFTISDYKKIVEQFWMRKPEDKPETFETFDSAFSIDVGYGSNKADRIRWMSDFSTHRNKLAHAGSKNDGLNNKEVEFLELVYRHFYPA